MGYLVYGLVRVIEATLFYMLAFLVAGYLKSPIPPIGSQAYIIFVVIWPFAVPLLRPGLRTIPIIGEVFSVFDQLAHSCLGKTKPAENVLQAGVKATDCRDTQDSQEEHSENMKQSRCADRKEAIDMKRIRRILQAIAAFTLTIFVIAVCYAQETGSDVLLAQARSAIRSAKYQDAIKKATDILTKDPTSAAAWCLKGEAQSRLKDTTAALESFNKAIQADKASIYAVVGKANTLAELKNEAAEAQELLRQAASMTPSSAVDYLARGAAFRALGQYEKALADYDEALQRKPDFPEIQMNKGMVYWHKGDYASAIPLFTAAIKLDPNFVEALANRGAAYRKTGNINSAITDYSKAIEVNPNDAMTFYNRGVAHEKQQLHERAIADFTSAIRLQPRYPEAYLNRGVAYTGVNKIAEAKQDFQKAAEQDPSGEAGQKAKRGLEMLKGY